uniref:Uncharacterized protein n=1 Tax=Glossina pallidipes TaxID=7398 RepID=A0A1A9ZTQ4_GLOPL
MTTSSPRLSYSNEDSLGDFFQRYTHCMATTPNVLACRSQMFSISCEWIFFKRSKSSRSLESEFADCITIKCLEEAIVKSVQLCIANSMENDFYLLKSKIY